MSDSVLRLDGVRVVRAGREVLHVPSLELRAGERTAVTGPIGSGKSTLLLAAAGVIDIAAGTVSLRGRPFHTGRAPGLLECRRRIGLVAQDPYLFRGTVEQNVGLGLRCRGVARAEARDRAASWLERLGIASLARRRAGTLSGGERRLVALARALVLEPEVLLLDEPTTHLDREVVPRVERLLATSLSASTTLVLATHDAMLAARLAGRVVGLEDGRVVDVVSGHGT